MEINGIATAKTILILMRRGLYTQEEIPKAIDDAIGALDEQMAYLAGNNPDKFFGYPQTYNK